MRPAECPSRAPHKEYGYRAGELLVTAGPRQPPQGPAAAAPNASAFVSQSLPAAMLAGHTYAASVTFRNTGSNTWAAAGQYRLGSQNPQDNNTWGAGGGRVSLPSSVAPNGEVTFDFTVTAPPSPGTYDFRWRMVQDGVEWFGDYTTNVSVTVSAAGGGGGGGVRWLVADQLGTPRMVVDETGSLSGVKRHDYLPFGEELPLNVGGRTLARGYMGDNVRQQFTGYERDDEINLDYAQARYYSNILGRFTGVDPENAGAYEEDPQSWNGYAYARNNPVLYTDPDGLEYKVCDSTGRCWSHWDSNWKPVLKDTEGAKAAGITIKGNMKSGVILDAEGNQIGTYNWVGEDYWSNSTNRLMYGELPKRTVLIPKIVGYSLGASAAIGAGIGVVAAGPATIAAATGIGAATQSAIGLTTKVAARDAIARMSVSEVAKAAARRAVARATTKSTIDIVREGSSLTVRITRPGRDGYQIMESVIKSDGTKTTVQKAFDAAGKLVHYHPK